MKKLDHKKLTFCVATATSRQITVFFCSDRHVACRFVEGFLLRIHRNASGHRTALGNYLFFFSLFSFLFSFFLWIKLGLFLLFSFAFIFFSLITHICFSLFENDLCFLTCPRNPYRSGPTRTRSSEPSFPSSSTSLSAHYRDRQANHVSYFDLRSSSFTIGRLPANFLFSSGIPACMAQQDCFVCL